MKQEHYNNILSFLSTRESSTVSFTSAWKGYEIESKDADNKIVKEMAQWFYDEFIHTLIDLGIDAEEMIFKFYIADNTLMLDGTFIFKNENWSREDIYHFSDLIGDPIVNLISENLNSNAGSINEEEIELNFNYSSQDSILKELRINYQNDEIVLTELQSKNISAYLLYIIEKWDASENRATQLSNIFRQVHVEYNTISVETHGNASFQITTDSICLI